MSKSNLLFLFGVLPRSGTNFVFKSILLHPDINKSFHPGEDYILSQSQHLKLYVDKLVDKWSPRWEGTDRVVQKKRILDNLSKAHYNYLKQDDNIKAKYIFTKTPSTEGIENLSMLFPESKAIFLVRDGKSLIRSGVKSFIWTYIDSMKKYAQSLSRIKSIVSQDNHKNCLVINYEKFCSNPEKELKSIYNFLELDPSSINYSQVSQMPVLGSSDHIDDKTGKFKWVVSNESSSTKPKFKKLEWHPLMLKRYNSICKIASEFGYDDSNVSFDNSFKAFIFYIREELREIKRRLFYNK